MGVPAALTPAKVSLDASPPENLFLRKQLAFYLERRVKPRRADGATRITLVACRASLSGAIFSLS